MRITELVFEMATLHPSKTGLPLSIYVGPEQVYGTRLPHNLPRIKIRTIYGDIPLVIPTRKDEIPNFPPLLQHRTEEMTRKIHPDILNQIQRYIIQHRQALLDFYYQKINEHQLKQLLGINV